MRARVATATGIGIASFLVYLFTLAPGLTWAHQGADGGDLAAVVASGGIPHPPGYPTYVLLGRLFAVLPVRDVAFRLNLMSATCAAATVALLYVLALALTCVIAAAAALTFAFSPVFWSQALITEVYALNALVVAAALLLAVGLRRHLVVLGLALGLGLGNHLSLVLLIPSVALVLRRWPCLFAFLAGLSVYLYLPLRAAGDPLVNWGDP